VHRAVVRGTTDGTAGKAQGRLELLAGPALIRLI
jgi:hypothetical protein